MKTRDANAFCRFDDWQMQRPVPPPIDTKNFPPQPLEKILNAKKKLIERHAAETKIVKKFQRHVARLQRYQMKLGEIISQTGNPTELEKLNSKVNRSVKLIAQYNSNAALFQLTANALTHSIYAMEMAARMVFLRTFADRLKQARQAAGLSQVELAEKLIMKKPTLAAYDQGRNEPPLLTIAQLARELNHSVDWFLGLEE